MVPFREALLQYAWKTRRWATEGLCTTTGAPVQVLAPGVLNHDAGPDFRGVRVRIGDAEWAGDAEMHVLGNDWYTHQHHKDAAYNPVVLHVVWQPSSQPPLRADGTVIPEIVLHGRIDLELLQRGAELENTLGPLACAHRLAHVPPLHRHHWAETLGWDRTLARVELLQQELTNVGADWRQLAWQEVAKAFGGKANKEAFLAVAKAVPAHVVASKADDPETIEALLLGAAGFLDDPAVLPPPDDHVRRLQQLWQHAQFKHGLQAVGMARFSFGRLRPANFPTVRLAQMAALWHAQPELLHLARQPDTMLRLAGTLYPSPYWLTHYTLGTEAKPRPKALGRDFAELTIMNALVPLGVFYHQYIGDSAGMERLMETLQTLPAEDNRITRVYAHHGWKPQNALQSQGLLHLERTYCTPRRCLQCAIGHRTLLPEHAGPRVVHRSFAKR